MAYWDQTNTNLAFAQLNQGDAKFVTGGYSGRAFDFNWESVQYAMAVSSLDHVAFYSDFLGSTTPNEITTDTGGNAGTASTTGSNLSLATAGTASGDYLTAAIGTHWVADNGWLQFDATYEIDSVANVIFEIGLSDATSEASGLAFSDHTVSGATAVATDAVLLAFDTTGESNLVVATVNADTPKIVDGGIAPSANTAYDVRILVSPTGNAYVYVDGTLLAQVDSAVDTSATLTPFVTVVTQETASKTLLVDQLGTAGSKA